MGFVWASFRGDCWTRAAGGADTGGAIWIFAGDVVVDCGRSVCRMRAGFCDSVLLDPAKWEIPRGNGTRRSGEARGIHRAARGAGDSDYFAGRCGARGGECAEDFAVGDIHAGDDDSNCVVDGSVPAIFAAGTRAGSLVDWPRAGDVRRRGGGGGGGFRGVGKRGLAEVSGAGVLGYFVRVFGIRGARVVAFCAAPLF